MLLALAGKSIDTCAAWLDSLAGEMHARAIEVDRKGESNGKAAFWLYGPQHLVDVTVWNLAAYSSAWSASGLGTCRSRPNKRPPGDLTCTRLSNCPAEPCWTP